MPRLLTGAAFLLAGVLFFARLGGLPLVDPDEGRNAEVAREMLEGSGSWLVPTFNDLPYLDKPALYFHAVAFSLRLFGLSETATRLPSALSAAMLACVLFAFCRRIYGERAAALTVLVLSTTPLVLGFARLVIFDMPLALFTTTAVLAGYRAEEQGGPAGRRWLLLGATSSAIATLIKGPVGFLVPALVLAAFHLVERRPRALLRLVAPTNLVLFLGLVLPWFFGVMREHPDFFRYGLLEETLRRYLTSASRRTEPVFYYAPVLLLAFYPWSVLLPEAAAAAWRTRARWAMSDRFLLVWTVVVLIFFSTSQSKRPGYILPGIIALSALTGRLLDRAVTKGMHRAGRMVLRGTLGVALVSAAAAGILLVNVYEPGRLETLLRFESNEFRRLQPVLGPIVLSLLGLAAGGAAVHRRGDVRLAIAVFALPSVLFLTVNFAVLQRYADASSARPLARALPPLPAGTTVACLDCFSIGLPFYLGRPVTYITHNGKGLRSNYIDYRLRHAATWPAGLVHLDDRARWLARQVVPVYLLARQPARALLDDLASATGVPAVEIHPGWWGMLLLPRRGP